MPAGLASLDQLNEIDPTLPRSNPRERAKLFKREEKPAVDLVTKTETFTLNLEKPASAEAVLQTLGRKE